MFKESFILLFALAVTATAHAENKCPASNGYITTNVQAEAKASFLHTIEHHWKFEFWRGAVCWGKPDDQYADDQGFKQGSDQCSGAMTFQTDRSNQTNYAPMTLSWGANLTDGDTFSIQLDDTRVQAVYNESHSDCTTHRLGAKLQYASMVYETKAVINVPEDVWIVQVRAHSEISSGSSIIDLNPQIGRSVLKNDKDPTAYLHSLSTREWTYLYVEPGETLDVAVNYKNQGLVGEKKYNVRYDFKFIGHNRCVEVLGDPKLTNYSPEYLQKIVSSPINSEDDYHKYAVKLGCMRNPVFLKAAMNNSRPDSLVPALQTLNSRTNEVIDQGRDNLNRQYAGPFFATIMDMTLVDISRFALSDLLNYCQTYRDFTRETAVNTQTTDVAGVEFMMLTYSHLDMIYNQLARQSLDTLVNNLQIWGAQKATYAQLFDGNKDAQTALRAYQNAMVQMGLEIYKTISGEISARVPQVEIAQTHREQLLGDLQSATTVANYVNVALRQLLRNFGSRSNSAVNVTQLAANVRQLSALDQKIHGEMQEYFKWFVSSGNGGDNGDRFVRTLATLQISVLKPSAENLSFIANQENLKSLEQKFVRRADLNQLNQKINQCVFHPYGGGK